MATAKLCCWLSSKFPRSVQLQQATTNTTPHKVSDRPPDMIDHRTLDDNIESAPWDPGPWFNIKISSYQYRKSHCGDKTVVRSPYLHNGISYTGKMSSLYWIGARIRLSTGWFDVPVLDCFIRFIDADEKQRITSMFQNVHNAQLVSTLSQ